MGFHDFVLVLFFESCHSIARIRSLTTNWKINENHSENPTLDRFRSFTTLARKHKENHSKNPTLGCTMTNFCRPSIVSDRSQQSHPTLECTLRDDDEFFVVALDLFRSFTRKHKENHSKNPTLNTARKLERKITSNTRVHTSR